MLKRAILLFCLGLVAAPLAGCVVEPVPVVGGGCAWVPAHWNGWRWIPGHCA